MQIMHVRLILNGFVSKFIRCAVGHTAFDAAAGKPDGKTARIVISAVHDITSDEAYRDGVIYQILGALQGLSGEDLDNYRGEQQVANVLKRMAQDSDSSHDISASR